MESACHRASNLIGLILDGTPDAALPKARQVCGVIKVAGNWLQVRTPTRAGGWISAGPVRLNVPVQQVPVPADIPVAAAVPAKKARAVVVPVAPKAAPPIAAPSGKCDPSYPDVCTPSPSPDLDCPEISYRSFRVIEPDPHRFDGDHDGIGCEK